jgi:beta-carotene hydroxylase
MDLKNKNLKALIIENIIEKQNSMDYFTIFLFIVTAILQIMTLCFHYMGIIPFYASVIVSCFLMNLSFTFWHECSHGNLTNIKWLNTTIGILSSFFSYFPGYFTRKREHLIHHRFEGIANQDPVFFRIQNTNAVKFLFTALYVNYFRRPSSEVPAGFLSLTRSQIYIDKLTVATVSSIILWLFYVGSFHVALATIIIPRVFIFVFHGYVICFFPHFIKNNFGYQKFRVIPGNIIMRILTMNQNYHGIHHYIPRVRWYNYPLVLKKYRDLFSENNIELK